MTTLQAERPLDADIFTGINRFSVAATRLSQAALPSPRRDDDAAPAIYATVSGDRDEPVLVPSPLVGLSIGLVQASMFWPVLQPV